MRRRSFASAYPSSLFPLPPPPDHRRAYRVERVRSSALACLGDAVASFPHRYGLALVLRLNWTQDRSHRSVYSPIDAGADPYRRLQLFNSKRMRWHGYHCSTYGKYRKGERMLSFPSLGGAQMLTVHRTKKSNQLLEIYLFLIVVINMTIMN